MGGDKASTVTVDGAHKAAQKTPPTPQFLRTTLRQLVLICIGAPIGLWLWGASSTVSLLSGAACAVLPQAYFALRMARASRLGAQRAARMGLVAEGGKFLLSAVSFALVFAVLRPAQPGLVFLGFGVFWVVQLVDSIHALRAR